MLVALALLVGTVYAGVPADAAAALEPAAGAEQGVRPGTDAETGGAAAVRPDATLEDELVRLEERVTRVNGAWAELASYYDERVEPLSRVLYRFSRDTALVEHIAVALVREANRVDVDARLLLAVLLVENPWLDPDIRSPVGAIGLMQVMPIHRGGWSQCGTDLEDIDANICYGAHIFAHYFHRSGGNIDRALLRYNGCVRGTNTPDCHQYPNHVFAHAGRASVLTWLGQAGPAAGSP